MSPRATLRLTLACDNACIFCAQAGLESDPANIEAELARLRAEDHEELTFIGGEPLLVDDLEQVVSRARELGFTRVGVQSNGGRLGEDDELLVRLAAAGLTDAHLSIHGAREDVHDHHVGRSGAFAHSLRAMSGARAAGVDIVVTTVLTRSNQGVIGELPALLARHNVRAWQVVIPIGRGRAEERLANVTPRLAIALPYALHALARAEQAGIEAHITGAPLCLLGPFADRAAVSERPRAYAASCDDCAARSACPGVDPHYLESFGGDELRPRRLPAPPRNTRWAALFVGIGELAPPRSRKRGAVGLPVLG